MTTGIKSEPDSKPTSKIAEGDKSELYEDPDVIDLCDGDDNMPMDDQDDVIQCLKVKSSKTHIQDR